MSGEIPARRLFLDPESEERRYFDEVGSFPIMHVIAIQESLAVEKPRAAVAADGDLPLRV